MLESTVRSAIYRLTNRAAAWLGYRLVRDTMYSPLPEVPENHSPEWELNSSLAGLSIETPTQLKWLREELSVYFKEFFPVEERDSEAWKLYSQNAFYTTGDAEVLYGMLRYFKPARVLEIGSGFSTLVSAMAISRNARDGALTRFTSVDPEPRLSLPEPYRDYVELRECRSQDLALDTYLALDRGDFLIIDSTHTVKRGSDVNHLILEVLPRLRRGSVVHFHDIFLPWDYPREWFRQGVYLAEQYLLQGYLSENPRYRVLLAMHMLARNHPNQIRDLIPDYRPYYHGPSAFWMERQ